MAIIWLPSTYAGSQSFVVQWTLKLKRFQTTWSGIYWISRKHNIKELHQSPAPMHSCWLENLTERRHQLQDARPVLDQPWHSCNPTSMQKPARYVSNVVKPLVNLQFGYGLHRPFTSFTSFMAKWGSFPHRIHPMTGCFNGMKSVKNGFRYPPIYWLV